MRRRNKLSRRSSNKKFRNGARTNIVNLKPRPMRGGTRL